MSAKVGEWGFCLLSESTLGGAFNLNLPVRVDVEGVDVGIDSRSNFLTRSLLPCFRMKLIAGTRCSVSLGS